MQADALIAAVQALDPELTLRTACDRPTFVVTPERLVSLATQLRDIPELALDLLETHTAIDWLAEGRFELLYLLTSTRHGHHVTLSVSVPRDNPVVPTIGGVYPIGEFHEREVYDLMGILYDDHPDLRRLFLEDDWVGFPLRKDYDDDFVLTRPT